MAKRGGTRHQKRVAAPKAILIHGRKEAVWLLHASPGPHSTHAAVTLGVLLRDILGVAKTLRESKKILSQRAVFVDGRVRTNPRFPVGLMDVVEFPTAAQAYRIVVDHHGRLVPKSIPSGEKNHKLVRVINKYVVRNGQSALALHDGKTIRGEGKVHVGDSIRIQLPDPKLQEVIPLAPGTSCLVREGKHAGTIAQLKELIRRKEGKEKEARLVHGKEEFITVAKYLVAVDDKFKHWAEAESKREEA